MDNFVGKKLLILGGVRQMLDFVKTAQKMGVLVYVTDNVVDSPCKKIADKSFMISATDVDAVVQLIKDEGIDGVITGYVDMLLPFYADICRNAGLPSYGTKEQFDLITDKAAMKRLCKKYHVPIPQEYSIEDVSNNSVSFPVFVKPADSSGSRGCSVCRDTDELQKAIDYALSFSKKKEYIIEDYLTEGRVLLQFFVQDGIPVFLCCSDTYEVKHYSDRPAIASCGIQPSNLSSYFVDELLPRYNELFQGMELRNGPIEVETYINDGTILLGDIGYRLCGGRMNYLTKEVFGIDFYELLIRFAITGKVSEIPLNTLCSSDLFGKYAAQVNFYIEPGTVDQIVGADKLSLIKGVFYSGIFVDSGFTINDEDRGKLVQCVARIRIISDSLIDLETTMYDVYNTLDFLDDMGNSLKINTAFYSDYIKNYKLRGEI